MNMPCLRGQTNNICFFSFLYIYIYINNYKNEHAIFEASTNEYLFLRPQQINIHLLKPQK